MSTADPPGGGPLDHDRISELLEAALSLPEMERRDHLEREAPPHLFERVMDMLDAHRAAEGFLDSPTTESEPALDLSGTMIGRYKLLQRIGEGGFGVVYMAEQHRPVRRRVAVKIIKAGMDTKQVIARFEAERQALALMDHPGIARVLDAGSTSQGRPYFVMELVSGVPITRYCDDAGLGPLDRLALFQEICQAVQHAHRRGIIHRDLKPSNILVTLHDGEPVVKVIDFGIAKAISRSLTERTLFTDFRQFIGTPEYMSPEQAALSGLDIDTRTDVYSLGVLLYEMLTGVTPIDARSLREAAFGEMHRLIRESDPPKPSTRVSTLGDHAEEIARLRGTEAASLGRALRGDLDWVVMKALSKDRRQRYDSPSEFAEDIDRYLSDLPVEAGPPSPSYRFAKFAKRNRGLLAAAGAVTLAVLAGGVLSSVGFVQAQTEAENARLARDDAILAREQAELERDRALTAREFVLELFASVEPPNGTDAQNQSGRDVRVVDVLDRAFKRLAEGDTGLRPIEEVDLRVTLARTYAAVGEVRQSVDALHIARRVAIDEFGESDPVYLEVTAELAGRLADLGRAEESRPLASEAVPEAESTLGPAHWVTLRLMSALGRSEPRGEGESTLLAAAERAEALPDGDRGRAELPRLYDALAVRATETNRPSDAQRYARLAADAGRGELPLMDRLQLDLGAANAAASAGRLDQAIEKMSATIGPLQRLLTEDHVTVRDSRQQLARWLVASDRKDEALEQFGVLLETLGPGAAPITRASLLNSVAELELELGFPDAARTHYEELRAIANAFGVSVESRQREWAPVAARIAMGRRQSWADPGLYDQLLQHLVQALADAEPADRGYAPGDLPGVEVLVLEWPSEAPTGLVPLEDARLIELDHGAVFAGVRVTLPRSAPVVNGDWLFAGDWRLAVYDHATASSIAADRGAAILDLAYGDDIQPDATSDTKIIGSGVIDELRRRPDAPHGVRDQGPIVYEASITLPGPASYFLSSRTHYSQLLTLGGVRFHEQIYPRSETFVEVDRDTELRYVAAGHILTSSYDGRRGLSPIQIKPASAEALIASGRARGLAPRALVAELEERVDRFGWNARRARGRHVILDIEQQLVELTPAQVLDRLGNIYASQSDDVSGQIQTLTEMIAVHDGNPPEPRASAVEAFGRLGASPPNAHAEAAIATYPVAVLADATGRDRLEELAGLLTERGAPGDADRALNIRRRLYTHALLHAPPGDGHGGNPAGRELALLAQALSVVGATPEAESIASDLVTRAERIAEPWTGGDPSDDPGRLDAAAGGTHDIASSLHTAGFDDQAVAAFRVALDLADRRWGREHMETTHRMYGLGTALIALERFGEAAEVFAEIRDIRAEIFAPDDREVTWPLEQLAIALTGAGELEAAVEADLRCIEIMDRYGPPHPYPQPIVLRVARNLVQIGRGSEAAERAAAFFLSSYEWFDPEHPPPAHFVHGSVDETYADIAEVIARAHEQAGNHELARHWATRLLDATIREEIRSSQDRSGRLEQLISRLRSSPGP